MHPDAFELPLPPPDPSNLSLPPHTPSTVYGTASTPSSQGSNLVGAPLDHVSRGDAIGDSAVETSTSNSGGATGEGEDRVNQDITVGCSSDLNPRGVRLGRESANDSTATSLLNAGFLSPGGSTSSRSEAVELLPLPGRYFQRPSETTSSPESTYHFPSLPSASPSSYQSPGSLNAQQRSLSAEPFPTNYHADASTAASNNSSATSDSYSSPSSRSEQSSSSSNKSGSVGSSRNTTGFIENRFLDERGGAAVQEVGLGMSLGSKRGSIAEGDEKEDLEQRERRFNSVADGTTSRHELFGGDEDSNARSTGKVENSGHFARGSDSEAFLPSMSQETRSRKELSVVSPPARSGTGVATSVLASLLSPMSPLVAPFSPTLPPGVSSVTGTSARDLVGEATIWGGGSNVHDSKTFPFSLQSHSELHQQQYQLQQQQQNSAPQSKSLASSYNSSPYTSLSRSSVSSLSLASSGQQSFGMDSSGRERKYSSSNSLLSLGLGLGGLSSPKDGTLSITPTSNPLLSTQHFSHMNSGAYGPELGANFGHLQADDAKFSTAMSTGSSSREGNSGSSFRPSMSSVGGVVSDRGNMSGGEGAEEISTIFVVGFPDNLKEREFQNMFLFAQGFEGATLKIPLGSFITDGGTDRDIFGAGTSSSPAGMSGSNSGGNFGGYQDFYGGMLEPDAIPFDDTFSVPSQDSSNNDSTLHGFTSPLPNPLLAARKQIIGFAKFRTRAQAYEARDSLNGKRVDNEKGSVLKAEMAKKNLHTKRGQDDVSAVVASRNPATLAELGRQQSLAGTGLRGRYQQGPALETLHPTSPGGYSNGRRDRELSGPNSGGFGGMSASFSSRTSHLSESGAMSKEYYDEPISSHTTLSQQVPNPTLYRQLPRTDYSRPRELPSAGLSPPEYFSELSSRSSPTASSIQSSSARVRNAMLSTYSSNNLLQQLDEGYTVATPDLHHSSSSQFGTSLSSAASTAQFSGSHPDLYSTSHLDATIPLSPVLSSRHSSGSLYQYTPGSARLNGSSGSMGSPGLASLASTSAIPRTQNPADMNAPKNTLYVGGLPAVLPSLTGPFSAAHLEDSLRNAFCRCPGFRRLCFRSKSNGPIVFVEFDDVIYATRAMTEMYGSTLGGIVKGGIRLSYSKNPLGVRGSLPTAGPGLGPLSFNGVKTDANNGSAAHSHTYVAPYPDFSSGGRPSESVFSPAPPLECPFHQQQQLSSPPSLQSRSTQLPHPLPPNFGSTFAPFGYDRQ